jgi:DNA-binding winged helix-turn-helix (wHTH) protein/acyl-CoA thioesterase FadM
VQFYFENQILDLNRRELRRGSDLISLEPQVFDLLTYLMQNRDRVVSRDDLIASVWGGRIVSDSTLSTRINAARKAIGDSGEQQRLIRTMARKGFRFTGTVTEHVKLNETAAVAAAIPQQEVHFCTASDEVRIAYASAGQGVPLVKAANWLNHLEYDWHSPIWSHLLHALAAERRLIRYDERGNGLSDWDVDDISFEAFVRDLETVVDAAGLERFSLFGISQGSAVSIAYTVRHPERVDRLILYGGFARGRARRNPEQAETLLALIRQGWGSDNHASFSRRCSCRTATPSRCSGSTTCNASPRRRRMRSASCRPPDKSISPTCCRRCACRRWSCMPATTPRCRSTRAAGLRPAFRAPASWRSKAAATSLLKKSRPGADCSRRLRPSSRADRAALRAAKALHGPADVWHTAGMLDRVDFEPIFFAPSVSSVMKVEPTWIDYNGHLNMAYYNVLFDRAVDEVFELLGCGADYVKKGFSTFTAEVHVRYLRELHEGDPVRVTFQLLEYDSKRLHYFEQLFHAEEGWVSATSENMSLHVDMAAKKVAPFPPEVTRRLLQMKASHGQLPRPEAAGRSVQMPATR